MPSVDRTDPLPLWAQLERDLRRRLGAGEFTSRFPTDAELTAQYDVSRHTVREALRRLSEDGLLERQRGRGTVVRQTTVEQGLGSLYSLFATIESEGHLQTSRVLELEPSTDETASVMLDLVPGAHLLLLGRLRLIDNEPLAVDRVWLPLERVKPLLDVDFTHTALYDELQARCGFRPDSGWERIRPAIPTARETELLGLDSTDAVFRIERLGSVGDQPVEWRTSSVRGDLYSFVADWSATGASDNLRLAPSG